MLGHFRNVAIDNVENVPVCEDYCDEWFGAYQDDLTCVENWLDPANFAPEMSNSCPAGLATCRTFREVYGSGEGLCNRMWGTAYRNSTNSDNCTVMAFDISRLNPNFKLKFPDSSTSKVKWNSAVMCGSALLMFLLIAANM